MNIYVTFGQVHRHVVNGKVFDKDCVAVIKAETHREGREIAVKVFGDEFFTTYDDATFRNIIGMMDYYPRGKIKLED